MIFQILIKTANDWFEFTKSKTGQLDYVGKWEKDNKPDVDGAQKFASSTYFTPSYYIFVESAQHILYTKLLHLCRIGTQL